MGLITGIMSILFGGGRNVVRDTAEVFRENAEARAVREATLRADALGQFAAEFMVERRGWFDRLVDGLNRLPRPLLAFGVFALFGAAMVDPVWFSARMQGVALVPEPLWWLLGIIVSFYFGARHQVKSQEFQRSLASTLAKAPVAKANIEALESLRGTEPAPETGENAALADWKKARGDHG